MNNEEQAIREARIYDELKHADKAADAIIDALGSVGHAHGLIGLITDSGLLEDDTRADTAILSAGDWLEEAAVILGKTLSALKKSREVLESMNPVTEEENEE